MSDTSTSSSVEVVEKEKVDRKRKSSTQIISHSQSHSNSHPTSITGVAVAKKPPPVSLSDMEQTAQTHAPVAHLPHNEGPENKIEHDDSKPSPNIGDSNSSGSISKKQQPESASVKGGGKKKYVKVNQTLLDKQMNSIARAGLLRSTTVDLHAPDPEQNAPPGETNAQRRRRIDRISGRRKRARKLVELESLHQKMADLNERNVQLKRENQGFRDKIAEIKRAQERGESVVVSDLLGNAEPPAATEAAAISGSCNSSKGDLCSPGNNSQFSSRGNAAGSVAPTGLSSLLALSSAVHSQQSRFQQPLLSPQAQRAQQFPNSSATSSLHGLLAPQTQLHQLAALLSGNGLLPENHHLQQRQSQGQAQQGQNYNQLLSTLSNFPFSTQLPQTQNQGSTTVPSQFYGHSSSSSLEQQRLLSSLFSSGNMPQSSSAGNNHNNNLINIQAILQQQQQQQQQVRHRYDPVNSGTMQLQHSSAFHDLSTQGRSFLQILQSQTQLQAAAASGNPATGNHQQQSQLSQLSSSLLSYPSVPERVQPIAAAAAAAVAGNSGSPQQLLGQLSHLSPGGVSSVATASSAATTTGSNSAMPNPTTTTTTAAAASDRPPSPPPTNVKELKVWMERHKKRLQEERESRK